MRAEDVVQEAGLFGVWGVGVVGLAAGFYLGL